MADNKPILTIDVNDDQFKKFATAYNKFMEQVEKTPKAWRDVADAQRQAAPKSKLDHAVNKLEDHTKKFSNGFEKADQAAQKFGRTIKSVQTSVLDISKLVVGIGATFAGLGSLGLGAPLWLMDRIGQSAAATQTSGLQLNNAPGSMTAFNNAFKQFGIGSSMLGSISSGLQNPAMAAKWSADTGIPVQQLLSMNPSDIAVALMRSERSKVGSMPRNLWGVMNNALGYSAAGIDSSAANSINDSTNSQFQGAINSYQSNAGPMNSMYNPQVLQAWTNFVTQFNQNSSKLKAAATNDTGLIAIAFTNLSNTLSTLALAALASKPLKGFIYDFANGLNYIALNLGTWVSEIGPALDKIKGFFGAVGTSGKQALGGAEDQWDSAKGFFDFLYGAGAGQRAQTQFGQNTGKGFWGWLFGAAVNQAQFQNQAYYPSARGAAPAFTNAAYNIGGSRGGGGKWAALNAAAGLPPGFLEAVENTESNNNPFAVSPKGALGAFQFMPGTAAGLGLGNPFNEGQSAQAAATYFQQLLAQFGGNLSEATGAYNWGAGNVQGAMQRYGSGWLSHAPQETQNYVAKILGQLGGGGGGVRVIISNNTGGSAIVTTAAIQA